MSAPLRRTSRFIDSDGLALHVQEWGPEDAPPVVLLHGLRAYGQWFEEFCDAAAGPLRLIALDQRGRGRSAWDPQGRYTTDHYVADLEALVRTLGLRRFALVGHSMGGTNVVHYAARHPDEVSGLVIVDSAPELAAPGLQRIRAELGRTPASFATLEEARTFLAGLHHRATPRSIETRLEWMLQRNDDGSIGWRIDPKIFDPNLRPDPPERMWQVLPLIRCPTLVVRGAITDLIAPEVAERMLASLKDATLVEIPGAGHMIVEENPAGFTAAVVPFLQRVLA